MAKNPPPEPRFDIQSFFTGRTEGHATLKVLFSPVRKITVHGTGHMDGGELILDQTIEQEGKKPKTRSWRIHQVTPNRWEGSLSDAEGPVVAEVNGSLLHLSFIMKGGYPVEQWLVLQPGGKKTLNHMAVRKFGITIARLDEVIENLD